MIRRRIFSLIWRLVWPLRWYVTSAPIQYGKEFAKAIIARLLPPPPHAFTARLPLGRVLELQYREVIGLHMLLYGSFEAAEIECLCSLTERNSTAMDIGANVGLFTVTLAAAVGPAGHVMAFEPAPSNLARLKHNLDLNGASNVDVFPLAVAQEEGAIALHLSSDPAFHSTTEVRNDRSLDQMVIVPTSSLDDVWKQAGSPTVSVLKIDVEGGEFAVLSGGSRLLQTCRPAILAEIPEEERLREIDALLGQYGYRPRQPTGFMPWNYLFIAHGEHSMG